MYYLDSDQRQRDCGRRCSSILPYTRPHDVSDKCGELPVVHQTTSTDHTEEHTRYEDID